FTRLDLDVVHLTAERCIAQRHRVSGPDRRARAGDQFVRGSHAARRNDVAAFAVLVLQQREVRRAVRVVLEALDDRRNAVLVATEVDDAIPLLVSAALVTRRHSAVVIAPAVLLLRLDERSVRRAFVQARLDDLDDEAPSRRGWFGFDEWHRGF